MNKKLSERLAVLEEMGFDTSKYNVVINGNQIEISGVAHAVVEDKQVDNKKLFRRWITAQTFRMMYEPSYRYQAGRGYVQEYGWDNYLRNKYDYKYQFDMMLEEFRVLNKLSVKDKEEFEERSNFFNKDVAASTCAHYIKQFKKYARNNMNDGKVKLAQYGVCDKSKVNDIVDTLERIINDIKSSEDYAELYANLKRFMKKMNKVPANTSKCPTWKDAFKGSGAYYSLKNMVLFHNCLLRECANKQESMDKLTECLDVYRGECWRFHAMLKDTIELNNFDLRESIEKTK